MSDGGVNSSTINAYPVGSGAGDVAADADVTTVQWLSSSLGSSVVTTGRDDVTTVQFISHDISGTVVISGEGAVNVSQQEQIESSVVSPVNVAVPGQFPVATFQWVSSLVSGADIVNAATVFVPGGINSEEVNGFPVNGQSEFPTIGADVSAAKFTDSVVNPALISSFDAGQYCMLMDVVPPLERITYVPSRLRNACKQRPT